MSTTPAAWPNVILINETISYTRWISLLFFSFPFLHSPFPSGPPPFFPLLCRIAFFFQSVSFSRLVPEGARPAGSTGQLRETLLRVITSNLERSVFSFDTCTDMLQIFSDYFTTLRNLILRISTRNLLYFSFTHMSCIKMHLSF